MKTSTPIEHPPTEILETIAAFADMILGPDYDCVFLTYPTDPGHKFTPREDGTEALPALLSGHCTEHARALEMLIKTAKELCDMALKETDKQN